MNKNETKALGLPLEYGMLAEFFDAHNVSEQTFQVNHLVERLLSQQHVKKVLDMTCGTGSQVFFLHDKGYEVTGSDISPVLIEKAMQYAGERGVAIEFNIADMRQSDLGVFDAVIAIFNAIGHLSKNDFAHALKNMANHIKPGGVVLFDIFNLDAIHEKSMSVFDMDYSKKVGEKTLHHQQHSIVDKASGIMTSFDNYTIEYKDGTSEKLTNQFSLQLYSPKQLEDVLKEHGFEMIAQYNKEGNILDVQKDLSMFTLARKD